MGAGASKNGGEAANFCELAKNEVIEKSGLTTIWPCDTSCTFTAKVGSMYVRYSTQCRV